MNPRRLLGLFPKVHLLINESQNFNEAERQIRLIEAARECSADQRLLFALDADEILAADSISNPGWQRMLQAPPGDSILYRQADVPGRL